jgi:hypothetical protein
MKLTEKLNLALKIGGVAVLFLLAAFLAVVTVTVLAGWPLEI